MTIPVANSPIPMSSRGYGEGSRARSEVGHRKAKLRMRTMMDKKIDWSLIGWVSRKATLFQKRSDECYPCS